MMALMDSQEKLEHQGKEDQLVSEDQQDLLDLLERLGKLV